MFVMSQELRSRKISHRPSGTPRSSVLWRRSRFASHPRRTASHLWIPTFAQGGTAHAATRLAEISIPVLTVLCRFCMQFACTPTLWLLELPPQRFSCLAQLVSMNARATSNSGAMSILVADSNRMQVQLLAGALRRHPEFHITTCSLDTASILKAVTPKVPRVALLCLSPPADIAETILIMRRFHLSHPTVPKVVLVTSCDRDLIVSAFRSGARGIFAFNDANMRLLCKCLLRVAAGQIWVNTEQLNQLIGLISEIPSLRVVNSGGSPLLTPREEQVVALVAEGLGNRQIARELILSEHTIKKYLFRIFEKLGVSSRVELVLYAVNNGDPRHAKWLPEEDDSAAQSA